MLRSYYSKTSYKSTVMLSTFSCYFQCIQNCRSYKLPNTPYSKVLERKKVCTVTENKIKINEFKTKPNFFSNSISYREVCYNKSKKKRCNQRTYNIICSTLLKQSNIFVESVIVDLSIDQDFDEQYLYHSVLFCFCP